MICPAAWMQVRPSYASTRSTSIDPYSTPPSPSPSLLCIDPPLPSPLPPLLCLLQVRDCFWDDLPAGMEQPRYARNVSEAECFRGRSKSFMKGEDRTTTPGAAGEDGSSSDGDGKDSKDAQKAATLDATTTPDTSQHELGQQRLHLVPDVLTKAIRMQVSKRAAEQRAVREVLWQRDDLAVIQDGQSGRRLVRP